jgi:ParB family chromosome partitioning protein
MGPRTQGPGHPLVHRRGWPWPRRPWNRVATATSGGDDGSVASRLRAMAEADKAERRRVIANNREWDSATVRRDWLKGFLARRTAPRNAMTYIAVRLSRAGHDVRRAMESGHPSACELLGLTPAGSPFHGRPNRSRKRS